MLVGIDLAAAVAQALPRRLNRSWSWTRAPSGASPEVPVRQIWQRAVDVGAERVAVLPDGQEWVVQALAEVLEGGRRCAVVGVVGGCGGAGASVLSAALAVTGAGQGHRTLLADLDPMGGGIDLLLGAEDVPGLRWPDLVRARGRLSGGMLREALPRVDGLSLLSWDRGEHPAVPVEAATSVAGGAVRGFDLVVADLARCEASVPGGWLRLVDVGLVVVPASVRAVAAAARGGGARWPTVGDLRPWCAGRSAGLAAELVADSLGLPLLAELRPEPGLAAALERGEPPGLRRRGPLARCAVRVLDVTAHAERAGVSLPAGLDRELLGRVRDALADDRAVPSPGRVAAAVREAGVVVGGAGLLDVVDAVQAELSGLGPLTAALADPAVTDVLVNGSSGVWVDRGEGLQRAEVDLGDTADVRRLAVRLAAMAGRRLDDAAPWVDARLPDGTRLHAVLPPVVQGGPHISLRVPRRTTLSFDDLVAAGTVPEPWEPVLRALVAARAAYLVTGGTGAGKTTLLAALLAGAAGGASGRGRGLRRAEGDPPARRPARGAAGQRRGRRRGGDD